MVVISRVGDPLSAVAVGDVVLDDTHRGALRDGVQASGAVAADALTFDVGEQHAQVGAVGEFGDHVPLQRGLHPPQQLVRRWRRPRPRTLCCRSRGRPAPACRGSMLASSERASSRSSTSTPPRCASIDGVGAAFAQAEHLDLRVGGIKAQADTAPERVLVLGSVSDVELDTVDGHHPQVGQPRAGRSRAGQRPGYPRVELRVPDRHRAGRGPGPAPRRSAPASPRPRTAETADRRRVCASLLRRHRRRTTSSPARSTRPPGRQQTAATLGAAGVGQHLIDQIAVHQPGQHTKADPISQPVFATTFTTGNAIGHKR